VFFVFVLVLLTFWFARNSLLRIHRFDIYMFLLFQRLLLDDFRPTIAMLDKCMMLSYHYHIQMTLSRLYCWSSDDGIPAIRIISEGYTISNFALKYPRKLDNSPITTFQSFYYKCCSIGDVHLNYYSPKSCRMLIHQHQNNTLQPPPKIHLKNIPLN
jgi:hypothetical protein